MLRQWEGSDTKLSALDRHTVNRVRGAYIITHMFESHTKGPFTQAIFAAIFTVILVAISGRFQITRVNYWRFRGNLVAILHRYSSYFLSSGLEWGKPMERKERRDKFPLRGPSRQRFGNFPCKKCCEIATKFEQVQNSSDFSAIWIFKSP